MRAIKLNTTASKVENATARPTEARAKFEGGVMRRQHGASSACAALTTNIKVTVDFLLFVSYVLLELVHSRS